jgi:hypothetical protein
MRSNVQSRATILRRIRELEAELRRARTELKNLRTNDPATAEVVIRGARLSLERSNLECRLEAIRSVSNARLVSSSEMKGLT